MKKTGLLDLLAEQHRTFISNLRLLPELKWAALGDLYRMENKEQYPLKEWEEAVCHQPGRPKELPGFGADHPAG